MKSHEKFYFFFLRLRIQAIRFFDSALETMDSPRFRSPNVRSNFLQVFVRDNNVEQALRVLKKKMQREGVFREMRRRRFYEKPSEEAARRKSDAVRRMHKLARKQAIRDGLIAAPPRKKKEEIKRPIAFPGGA